MKFNSYTRTAALILVPNIFFIIFNLSYYSSILLQYGYINLALTILLHAAFGNTLFSFLFFSRYFYIAFCFVIFCLNCVVSYYKKVYSSHLTTEIVDYVLHSDTQGIRDHLDYQIFFWLFLFALLPTIILIKISAGYIITIRTWTMNWLSWLYLFVATCILASLTALPMQNYLGSVGYILPYNYIIVLEESFAQYWSKTSEPKQNSFVSELDHKHKNLVTVLIIGESARYDHFSINGYKRPTSPNLAKLDNLISFSKSYSLETYTSVGVPKIIRNNDLENHVSLIKLMEQNGFDTFWISNHRKHGDLVTEVAMESQQYMFRDNIHPKNTADKYDLALLYKLDETLSDNKDKNIFIILHAIGSHLNYDLRYPDEYKIYTPTCKRNYTFFGKDSCTDVENLTNSYDNSIFYSDYIISQIIEKLKNHNSMLIYVSDHGQSLGENGFYFHGADYETAPIEQTHIAMFMWASDQFLKKSDHHKFFSNAKANKDLKNTHANIFHSIPHCIGLKRNIDPSKSICK